MRDSVPVRYQDITPEKEEKALGQIDDALNGVYADKKKKLKVRRVRKAWPGQLKKYESQRKILAGRNSYSKTDNDATFMAHERRLHEERSAQARIQHADKHQQAVCPELYHLSVRR